MINALESNVTEIECFYFKKEKKKKKKRLIHVFFLKGSGFGSGFYRKMACTHMLQLENYECIESLDTKTKTCKEY